MVARIAISFIAMCCGFAWARCLLALNHFRSKFAILDSRMLVVAIVICTLEESF